MAPRPPPSGSAGLRSPRADDGIEPAHARDDLIKFADPPHPEAINFSAAAAATTAEEFYEEVEEGEEDDGSEFLERARSHQEAEDERAYEPEEQIDVSRYSLPLQTPGGKEDTFRFSWRRFCIFVGPGFLMSIAYLDPGNLESDLQAGAQTGYALLWILFWSTALGLLLQAIAARVGVVTGCHLAELCRMEYSPPVRWVLWVMTEVAIVGADIQEVIGCAIALRILSRGAIPIWAGVLITGLDRCVCGLVWVKHTPAMLWGMTEVAIVGADIQEVIGCAIALCILSRGAVPTWTELWHSQATGALCFLLLFLESFGIRTLEARARCFLLLFLENFGIRKLEALFGLFIAVMAASFARMFVEAAPDAGAIAHGMLVPSIPQGATSMAVSKLDRVIIPAVVLVPSIRHGATSMAVSILGLLVPSIPRGATSMAVSILGAVIMPHNIFLHSALVQSRAINRHSPPRVAEALLYFTLESALALLLSFLVNLCVVSVFARLFYGQPGAVDIGLDNAAEYLQGALNFGRDNAAGNLQAPWFQYVAVTVSKPSAQRPSQWCSSKRPAHPCPPLPTLARPCTLLPLQQAFGSTTFPVVFIWAAGLLAAGQSSTMTGTYTGQFVMSGFLDLHVRKWVRVLVTRTVAIVPTIVVALLYTSPASHTPHSPPQLSPPMAALAVQVTGGAGTVEGAAAAAAAGGLLNEAFFTPSPFPTSSMPFPLTNTSLPAPSFSSSPVSSSPSSLQLSTSQHTPLSTSLPSAPHMLSLSSLDVLNQWLNVLQSVQLPFAVIPLLAIASSTHVMGRYAIKGAVKVSVICC
ncbi:unnamed protein product [Closterium sp. NIES-64]|nr:unnamed protein product [Closterium sp. NIES-64]